MLRPITESFGWLLTMDESCKLGSRAKPLKFLPQIKSATDTALQPQCAPYASKSPTGVLDENENLKAPSVLF